MPQYIIGEWQVMPTMTETAVKAAIAAIESESATLIEKIEMLLSMATGLQQKPKDPAQLHQAIALYQHAIDLSDPGYPLLWARAMAGMGTALRTIPAEGFDLLLQAKALYEKALPILQAYAGPEEVAEAEMNLGLVLQSLVPSGETHLAESIQAYQRALRVFTGDTHPQEYAILQNNIAIAYLSMPLTGSTMQQGMAVQIFEQTLRSITLIEHPSEYAMLQNNLGNALQYLPSTHPVENNWRAIAAYNEALKVRTVRDTPLEYANTIANKANALSNLSDDPEHPELGNPNHLQQARRYYQEAREIFTQYGYLGQAEMVTQAIEEIEQEFGSLNDSQPKLIRH
jgi:tetratricopeptide (TPR) repeat protein